MKYIFPYSKSNLKDIIKKIKNNNYISQTNRNELDSIFKYKNISYLLEDRVDNIVQFYQSLNKEYIDDILLEYFDGSGYYVSDIDFKYEITLEKYSSEKATKIISDDYYQSIDKNIFLLCDILSFFENHYKLDVKLVRTINPMISFMIKHKNWIDYYTGDDFEFSKSLTYNEFLNIFSSIKNNTRLKRLGGDFYIYGTQWQYTIPNDPFQYHRTEVIYLTGNISYDIN